MDYLDPARQTKDRVVLFIGYILIAIAIAFAALVLLYQAYGFGFGKNGNVVQNGLVFFSSQPNPANIYINGRLNSSATDARMFLPSGIYQVKLTRAGYRDWDRRITVDGGSVEHFDYPLLIPKKLTSTKLASFAEAPGLASESPNKSWLIVENPTNLADFNLYKLSPSNKPTETDLTLPANLLTASTGTQSLQVIDWANDNNHVLMEHTYDGKTEYILVDIKDVTQSINLNTTFNISPTKLTLNNDQDNHFYAYDSTSQVLSSIDLNGSPAVQTVLTHVLAYATYGNNDILYVTSNGAKDGQVLVKLKTPGQTYTLTSLQPSGGYLLDLTTYSGVLYVAVGETSSSYTFIYEDPIGQLKNIPGQLLAPSWVLHVNQPDYLSFSDNAQFIMTENNYNYAVYDIENSLGYLYSDPKLTLDAPQTNATWMDGDRLIYVSHGKVIMQDYDNTNRQVLVKASSNYVPAFSANYDYMYTLVPAASSGQYNLEATPLLTSNDL